MKRQTMVKKNIQSKKVAVFSSNDLSKVCVWLKPGDKLKYDNSDTRDYFLDKFGEVPYKKVWYNGMEGYIVADAITM